MAATGSGAATGVKTDGAAVPPVLGDPKKGTIATAAGAPGAKPHKVLTLEDYLYAEGFAFDFFQAVQLLEQLDRGRRPVGRAGPPSVEVVRFKALLSLNFPPSSIFEIERATPTRPPLMSVAFMGLHGPSGVLPRHYTELLMRLEKEGKGPEKSALREWFDLFNHRMISLFYRAWEKYRFYTLYQRGEFTRPEPDAYTGTLYSLVGMGIPTLRNRLRVGFWEVREEQPVEKIFAGVDDLALLFYGGFLAQRPRNAISLAAFLADFFGFPVQVLQFQGKWLILDLENQSSLAGRNNALGVNFVVGNRVWDVQSKFRVRLGPLGYAKFSEFLPDKTPAPQRKAFFLLSHLVRLYAGPEMDFDVQVVLKAKEVPACRLTGGARLGWNTWIITKTPDHDADDAIFESEEVRWLNAYPFTEEAAEETA